MQTTRPQKGLSPIGKPLSIFGQSKNFTLCGVRAWESLDSFSEKTKTVIYEEKLTFNRFGNLWLHERNCTDATLQKHSIKCARTGR